MLWFKKESMAKRKKENENIALLKAIIDGLEEKKGHNIVVLDFVGFTQAVCDYFVICHSTSKVQAQALSESVEEIVKKTTGIRVSRREGVQNAEWILLDYFNIVVHIFIEEKRDFYKLEQLWADAKISSASEFLN